MRPITASARLAAPREDVFSLLSALDRHWLLADRWVKVVELDHVGDADALSPNGGSVRIHGPLGLRRTALTRVHTVRDGHVIEGEAILRRTRATVRWELSAGWGGATCVDLTAQVERASIPDRIALALGGRWWLKRRFSSTLERLAALVEPDVMRARGRARTASPSADPAPAHAHASGRR
jgi:hypothetical protein